MPGAMNLDKAMDMLDYLLAARAPNDSHRR
jgi:hypothetical protein